MSQTCIETATLCRLCRAHGTFMKSSVTTTVSNSRPFALCTVPRIKSVTIRDITVFRLYIGVASHHWVYEKQCFWIFRLTTCVNWAFLGAIIDPLTSSGTRLLYFSTTAILASSSRSSEAMAYTFRPLNPPNLSLQKVGWSNPDRKAL